MDVKVPDEESGEGWMIEDDAHSAPAELANAPTPAPWRVLIVDDDVDVHVVTKFSLSNACFLGRRLSFLHAYSGEEALTTLRNNPDIALVLLDVIMETSDAGLRVANQVRTELNNQLVRIVLRTGQPGQALEHSIILDYDINDFWCKTDLTTRKLFTTVISSLRNYADLLEGEQRQHALQAELEKLKIQRELVGVILQAVQHGESWSGELKVGEPEHRVALEAKPAAEAGEFIIHGRVLR